MGHVLSRQLRVHPAWTGPVHAQEESLLLQQPADIVVSITDHIWPAETASLSLTCKSTFRLLFHRIQAKIKEKKQRSVLLWLLERDPYVGSRFFYCHLCEGFHRNCNDRAFKPLQVMSRHHTEKPCLVKKAPLGLRFPFTYHNARPIMNRHFYGSPYGLPLSTLEVREMTLRVPGFPSWDREWRARIIRDELFVSCVHVISQNSTTIGFVALRREINHGDHPICCHQKVNSAWGNAFWGLRDGVWPANDEPFRPCQKVQGSCHFCLTDYEITIEWHESSGQRWWERLLFPDRVGWVISITAYHQLGSCRSYDWKFSIMTSRNSHWASSRCRVDHHPLGAVRQRWLGADSGDSGREGLPAAAVAGPFHEHYSEYGVSSMVE